MKMIARPKMFIENEWKKKLANRGKEFFKLSPKQNEETRAFGRKIEIPSFFF